MALEATIRIKSLSDTVTPLIVQKYIDLATADKDSGDSIELIPAKADKQIQIFVIALATDTAGTFLLQTGFDPIFPFLLTASAPLFKHSEVKCRPLFVGNIGEDISMNVNVAPEVAGVYLQYQYK